MSYTPISELHDYLEAQGLPVSGVTASSPPFVNSWRTPPTAQQMADAASICAAFDMRPRKRRSFSDIEAEVNGLSGADKAKLANGVQNLINNSTEFASLLAKAVIKNLTLAQKLALLLDLSVQVIAMRPRFCDGLGMSQVVLGSELA